MWLLCPVRLNWRKFILLFSFASDYQLDVASGLEMGIYVLFISQQWTHLTYICTYHMHAATVSVYSYVSVLLCLETLFPQYPPLPVSLIICLLLCRVSRAPRGRIMKISHLVLGIPRSHSLYIVQL